MENLNNKLPKEQKGYLSAKLHLTLEEMNYKLYNEEGFKLIHNILKTYEEYGILEKKTQSYTKFDGERRDWVHWISFKSIGWSEKTIVIIYN